MFRRWGLPIFLVLGILSGSSAADDIGRCSIPIKLQRGIPFVRVTLNGRGPFTFAVDTGTSREAIVSPALVRELSLPIVGRTWLLDLTGKSRQAVDEVSIENVALPGRDFRAVRAMVHEPVASLGRYDGVLGFSLFRDTLLTLDFPRRCLRLEDGGLAEGTDLNVLPFSMPRNVPVIVLTMGEQKVPAQIDSAGGGINLPGSAASAVEFARHTEIQVRAQTQVSTFFLQGGVMKANLGLGGHIFQQPFVEIGAQIPVGNLGAISLQDFAVTFDQKQRLVRFQARKNVHRLYRSDLVERSREPGSSTSKAAGF